MADVIFYSWQSDLPNATNRGFIERALQAAAKALASADTEVEPVIDRDTAGVPGSPDIATTIFAKIDAAAVFVADVSIIGNTVTGKATPNPNVLLELGYALRAIGSTRVILVMNTAFGAPETLPFDLRMRRITSYVAPEDDTERSPERKRLEGVLTEALQLALAEARRSAIPAQPRVTTVDGAVDAIRNAERDRGRKVRLLMQEEVAAIAALHPGGASRIADYDERVLAAIAGSAPLVERFTRMADAIADADDAESLGVLLSEFEPLLERFNLAPERTGSFTDSDFDVDRFVGHELYVTLAATLLRNRRWERLRDLFEHQFYVRNINGTRTGMVSFDYLSQTVMSLVIRKERLKLNRTSIRADVLFERHGEHGPLSDVMPMRDFMAADFLLFLRGEVQSEEVDRWPAWVPWSTVYMQRETPRYLLEAERQQFASQLADILGARDLQVMKSRIKDRINKAVFDRLAGWPPVSASIIENIGTKT